MLLPIMAYGHPVLKQEAEDIDKNYPGLTKLLVDMWKTMYHASGVGLAAPQIGKPIRLFLVDTIQIQEEGEEHLGIKKAFINAEIIEESGKAWTYEEGCLSIPDIRGDVVRKPKITIEYHDENFKLHTETFEGMNARVIQHEYDHTDGILFTELLKPLKRSLIKRKLEKIRKGQVATDYKMKFSSK